MIIIETCPKCGHDLVDEIIATNPPIPRKVCWSCGWSWEGEPEKIMRVPFGGNNLITNDLVDKLKEYTVLNANFDDSIINNFEQSACINCPNNPKNGGDGICFCTLGQQVIY